MAITKAVDLLGLSGIGRLYTPQISPQAVHKWVVTGIVPAGRVLAIEAATDGRVSRHELRPDLYPTSAASASSPAPASDHTTEREAA